MTTFFMDAFELDPSLMNSIENLPGQDKNPMLDLNYDIFTKYQGLIYIAGVPISAIASWLTYYLLGNRYYNFTEHLVLNLYYSAQVIIITAITVIMFLVFGLNILIVFTISIIPTFLYLAYVLKKVFKESLKETFLKFVMMMIIYGITYFVVALIFVLLLIIIFGSDKT